jgi:allophanate hydrolase subunit 1
MEGSCSTGQNPQRTVVPVEEKEEEEEEEEEEVIGIPVSYKKNGNSRPTV